MKIFILLLFLFFSNKTFSQFIITGKVLDFTTKKGIPFTTVGLLKENKGVTADKDGFFQLTINNEKLDSLIFTCVGYIKKTIPINTRKEPLIISLEKEEKILDTVFLNSVRKIQVLNEFKKCGDQFYISNNSSFSQIAQLFETDNQNSFLQEITICTNGSFCSFRLHFYNFNDTLFCPGKEITDTSLIVSIFKEKQKINLKSYKIKIPNKKFFTSIEWLNLSSNEKIFKGKNGDKKSLSVMYYPAISIEDIINDKEMSKNRTWILNFNGKWINGYNFMKNKNFLISIIVK